MTHLKKEKAPTSWPIPRKGRRTFLAKPKSNEEKGIPILFVLRDMLEVAQNRKEVKKAISEKKVMLNQKKIKDVRNAAMLFDKVSLIPSKKHYKIDLTDNGRFTVTEIPEKEAGKKISKVINKKRIKGNKLQINLEDGRNFIQEIKCNTGDSAIVDLNKNKIEKILPLKKGSNVMIFAGKHSGKAGKIEKLDEENKIATINVDGEKMNALTKQIIVTE